MDETVQASIARVKAAREALGDGIKLMTDAHGTYSVPEAKQFAGGLRIATSTGLKEPISPDNRHGTAEVRASTAIPIAAGEANTPVSISVI